MAITFWRNVQRKITTQEMDASFDTLVNDIANAGISSEMPEGTIYIGDNTNTASLETLDTSIVPETTDKRYQSDLQDTYNDATSSIQGQLDDKLDLDGGNANQDIDIGANKFTSETLEVNKASGSGVAVNIVKGGAGEALTVTKTSGSGNVASFNGGITLVDDIIVSGATASTIAHFDATKNIESLPLATYPSLTELSYVKGVTSAIQTQINTSNNQVAYEVWDTNDNYTTLNTTAKRLIVLQTGTLTAPKTLNLTSLPIGSEVVIVTNSYCTATNYITVAPSYKFNSGANSDVINQQFKIVTYVSQSFGGLWYGSAQTNQFTETATLLSTTKGVVSNFFNNAGGSLGTTNGNFIVSAGYLRVYGSFANSAGINYITPHSLRNGWMNYRPTTIKWWTNGSNISAGNQPVNVLETLFDADTIGWNCSYSLELTSGFKCIFYVNGSGVPSITKIIQDNAQFVSVVSGNLQVNAGYCNATMFFVGYGDVTTYIATYKNLSYSSDLNTLIWSGNIGVGHTSQNASAILQADSTTKGFLPPRMTNAQRTAISSPAIGLMVYCTDATEGLYVYKSTGWTFII